MADKSKSRDRELHPAWWTVILIAVVGGLVVVCSTMFAGTFRSYVPVVLTSDRAGLVMESGGKVKMRGIQVGRVQAVQSGTDSVSLRLEIDPDQIHHIPANVEARIRATTAFGAKYVDLIYPEHPSPQRLTAGTVIKSENVSTEVNTVFGNLTGVLSQIDPSKLNGILSAMSEGLRGQGDSLGTAISDGNNVLQQLNSRADTFRGDWQSVKGFSDTYSGAATNILAVLDAASTTSGTITSHAQQLDSLLLNLTGLSQSGINFLAPNKDTLVHAINVLEPTTSLLMKYNPELTCLLVGGKNVIDFGFGDVTGGHDGKSVILDVALLPGKEPYKFPDNLPINGAKGGPGGQPGCGSLPDVSKNWPVRNLVTNTGFGTGLDNRPNPGIGFPGWANYFPQTRAVPEAPSIRYPVGTAPGPIPYPGAPPYGAPMYAPDGTPLWPGLPPAPAPGAAREASPPPPGSEPMVVQNPMQLPPTPAPPLPEAVVPAP